MVVLARNPQASFAAKRPETVRRLAAKSGPVQKLKNLGGVVIKVASGEQPGNLRKNSVERPVQGREKPKGSTNFQTYGDNTSLPKNE